MYIICIGVNIQAKHTFMYLHVSVCVFLRGQKEVRDFEQHRLVHCLLQTGTKESKHST